MAERPGKQFMAHATYPDEIDLRLCHLARQRCNRGIAGVFGRELFTPLHQPAEASAQ